MGLSVGIVGLPNVGKSTLFNALTRAQNAESANYPFCTIEPNKAVVPVPDPRLDEIARIAKSKQTIHATVDFVDIAGLVKGASRGEGLGNKFLANIRETDAILHVVRCFDDSNVVHVDGTVDPIRDIEVIEAELVLADLETIERRLEKVRKQARGDKALAARLPIYEELAEHLGAGRPAAEFPRREEEAAREILRELRLLTDKTMLYCCNVDEEGLAEGNAYVAAVEERARERGIEVVRVCARMEEELNGLSEEERAEFLDEFGAKESGLDQVIHAGYRALGLISFFTQGPKESRAWTIRRGDTAPKAAGVIHSDFERGFIRAQVMRYEDFVRLGGEQACREAGLLRTEGKEYVVQDGDIIEFLFSV